MDTVGEPWEQSLGRYRSYLLLLARMQLHQAQAKANDASDAVQQTLLDAHAHRDQFQGDSARLAGWLRAALVNNIRDLLRRRQRQKRDERREVSLEALAAQSSRRLDQWLAAQSASPSAQAVRSEQLLRLADALLELPESQGEAIVLHHLHGYSISQVAQSLQKTDAAVAGLLHRGLEKLRRILSQDS